MVHENGVRSLNYSGLLWKLNGIQSKEVKLTYGFGYSKSVRVCMSTVMYDGWLERNAS